MWQLSSGYKLEDGLGWKTSPLNSVPSVWQLGKSENGFGLSALGVDAPRPSVSQSSLLNEEFSLSVAQSGKQTKLSGVEGGGGARVLSK